MTKKLLTMLVAAVCLVSAAGVSAGDYQSVVTDDIWVYPYGGPASTLRAWGDGTNSVAPVYPAGSEYEHTFSYSYLKWDLTSIGPGNYTVLRAHLTVTNVANAGYTLEAAQANPLEARAVGSNFSEATWSYDAPTNPNPGGLFGNGDMSNYSPTSEFSITVDLLSGPSDFAAYFNSAVNGDGRVALALASAKIASQSGDAPYKLWSKDDLGHEASAPILHIEYAPVPEPGSLLVLSAGLTGFMGVLPRFVRRRR
ncbi:MAG: PEP-CTERM sorting domain-containing protein [Armatimonadetes bacterium]|nr:PEP-CTERM sorting domain-containing protein [Armatimonadota bacterium]